MNLLPITGDFVRALGWTILHSMWQAFFIYACLRIVLKLWPLAGARIRYNLSLLSLSGIFTWFLATLYMHMQRLQEARETVIQLHGPISLQAPVHMEAVYHSQDPLIWLFPNLELCFPLLVTLYIAGMTGMIIKLCSDLFQLHQIRTTRIEPMGAAWDKHLDKLAARLQIPRKVKLLISQHVQVPVMLGFLKPLILLPVAMVNNLTEEQLEAVLLHELAHIKRNDYLLNIFQSIVETILFFNPFVWLISKIIRIEREHCCDDLVIANTVQPLQYAHALVALEQYRLTANRLTMAAADSKQHLFHRIKRIMEMKTKHLNYSQKFLAVLIIATGLVSIAWLNPAKGKSNETVQKKIAEKKQIDSAPRKEVTTAIDYVAEPSSAANDRFKHQLDAVSIDTAILEIPTPPLPPPPPSPDVIPAPTPTPAPAPAPAPMAPLSPLKGELTSPQPPTPPQATYSYTSNYSFHKISDSTPVTVTSKVNVNTNNNLSSSVTYSNNTQVDKEEVRKQIREAQRSIQLAMKQLKEVDMKKVQAEVQAATKSINWQNVSAETRKAQAESIAALKNIDWDQINKAQAEAAAALKNIDFQAISKNLTLAYSSLNVSGDVRKQLDDARRMAGNAQEYSSNQLEEVRRQRAEALADAARTRREASKTREEGGRSREDLKKEAAEQEHATEQAKKVAAEQRDVADKARKTAAEQRDVSDKARKTAAEQRNVSDKARKTAAEQRNVSDQARKTAAEQGDVSDKARKTAAEQRNVSDQARKTAAEQGDVTEKALKTAAEHRDVAEKARKTSAEQKVIADSYQAMIRKMAADNLLDTNKDYSVEKNDKGLFINGVKQSNAVADKYSKYVKAKHVRIKGSSNTFNTDVEN
jgi:beta-lactamase regulating signal transducer with metallopeptidase domain